MTTTHSGQLKKTAVHSAIYAFGTIVRRLTGLVMLPIYTRYLTPADYGVVELLTMAIEIASILVGLRISQAMFRYYILAETEKEKCEIVSTVLFTVIASGAVGAGILYFAAEPLAKLIFGNDEYIFEFQLFAFTLITNAIIAVGLSFMRARQAPVLFVGVNIVSLMLQVCLNIYFVVMLEMHVTGVVYSALISGIVIAAGLSTYVLVKVGFHYSRSTAVMLIKFVAPLVLASIGTFYVAYADKYYLRLFSSLHDVGLYALAARVSSVLATIFEAFNMSWGADRFEIVKKDNARQIYEQVFRAINAVIILSGAGIALFANDFFRVMTKPEFYPAGNVVPILILAAIFSIYKTYCNFGALYKSKTGIMAEASWINAILATIGYVLLIPYIGVYGAAITSVFTNSVEFLWVYRKSKAQYDMGLEWMPVMLMLSTAVPLVILGLVVPAGEMLYFISRIFIFIILMFVIYKLPVWKDEEKEMMTSMLRSVIRKSSKFILFANRK